MDIVEIRQALLVILVFVLFVLTVYGFKLYLPSEDIFYTQEELEKQAKFIKKWQEMKL